MVYNLGFGGYAEDAFTGTEWLLVGVVQIAVMVLILGPLEKLRPVEPVTDRAAVRTDMLYTMIHRLGLFRLAMFFVLAPVMDGLEGHLRLLGWQRINVEDWWPGVTSIPLVSFFVYLLLFDLLDYWYHRFSHTYRWWWSLHATHHSQRQMTLWSDNRNHLLDDMLRDAVFATVALAVGVEPSQYVLLVALSQLLQASSTPTCGCISAGWGSGCWSRRASIARTTRWDCGHEQQAAGKPVRLAAATTA